MLELGLLLVNNQNVVPGKSNDVNPCHTSVNHFVLSTTSINHYQCFILLSFTFLYAQSKLDCFVARLMLRHSMILTEFGFSSADTSLSVDSCRLVANELQSSFKRASHLYKMVGYH